MDDSDIPRNLHNIVVSIHAIATFQALHDYLRPRVAGLLNSGSRLHGMLAALAASGFSSSGLRGHSTGTTQPPQPPAALAESSSAAASSNSSLGRRRSQRLSARNAPEGDVEPSVPASEALSTSADVPPTPEAGQPTAEGAPSETVVESELAADFSDDEEIDADVFDDDVDPDRSVSEKTVMLSIVEGK